MLRSSQSNRDRDFNEILCIFAAQGATKLGGSKFKARKNENVFRMVIIKKEIFDIHTLLCPCTELL